MCMGKTHARQALPVAACMVIFAEPLLHTVPLNTGLGVAVFLLVVGAAVLPDIDHPEATIAHTFGPITHLAAELVHATSAGLYHATRSRRDQDRDGGHRGITHTLLFTLVAGAGTDGLVQAFGLWAVAPLLFALTTVGIQALAGRRIDAGTALVFAASAASLTAGATFLMRDVPRGEIALWFGMAVAVGCLTHLAGDCLTVQGCPLFFPVPIRGQRWRMVGGPRLLRFHTERDSKVEAVLGFASMAVAAALGVWFAAHAFGVV